MFICSQVKAFQIDTTDGVQDTLTSPGDNIGDFASVREIDGNTGLGNVLDILVFSDTGSSSGTLTELLNIISAPSADHATLNSTNILGFGFGINESGNDPEIIFQEINFTFEAPTIAGDINSPTQTISFSLADDDDSGDPDLVTDLDLNIIATGGNNDSEIQVVVDFGFDLFAQYGYVDSANTGIADSFNYSVSALTQSEAGNEIIFLSSGITSAEQVPFEFSPLLGLGLSGLGIGSCQIKQKLFAKNKIN